MFSFLGVVTIIVVSISNEMKLIRVMKFDNWTKIFTEITRFVWQRKHNLNWNRIVIVCREEPRA